MLIGRKKIVLGLRCFDYSVAKMVFRGKYRKSYSIFNHSEDNSKNSRCWQVCIAIPEEISTNN